jgi:hypothetical protein
MLTNSRRSVARPHALWLATLCCILASACAGGSGSSGFDIAAENAAIDQALGSQSCTENAGLTICASTGEIGPVHTPEPTASATGIPSASDHPTPPTTPSARMATATPTSAAAATATVTRTTTAAPNASPTPAFTATPRGNATGTATPTTTPPRATSTVASTATPARSATTTGTRTTTTVPTPTVTPAPATPAVSTNVGNTGQLPCLASAEHGCVFVLQFASVGFPATAVYRVAIRTRNPNGAWRVEDIVGNSATLSLQVPGPSYQIAILVFLDDPGFVPDHVDALADTGAHYAFVTGVLTPTVVGTE